MARHRRKLVALVGDLNSVTLGDGYDGMVLGRRPRLPLDRALIDYALVSRTLAAWVRACDVVDDPVAQRASDHRPLLLELG